MTEQGYWFKSSTFEIEPGEDEDCNPRMYGRQLAIWLKARLNQSGYAIEEIINEDWGRCLICQRHPFALWVGCGSVTDYSTASPGDAPPSKDSVIWHCFVAAEVPFLKRMFGKSHAAPAVATLNDLLGQILGAEPGISLVEQP